MDTKATLPGGSQADGVVSVRTYIREHRQTDFTSNLSRKLLAYALNRSLQLSDEAIVDRMVAAMPAQEYRFDSLVEAIVTSPQFLNKRNPDPGETPASRAKKGE